VKLILNVDFYVLHTCNSSAWMQLLTDLLP